MYISDGAIRAGCKVEKFILALEFIKNPCHIRDIVIRQMKSVLCFVTIRNTRYLGLHICGYAEFSGTLDARQQFRSGR